MFISCGRFKFKGLFESAAFLPELIICFPDR